MQGLRRAGFTLIELLVVIAIIAFLMSLVGVVAMKAREKSRISRAKSLVKRIQVSMDGYRANFREYPPISSETWPSPYSIAGVELDRHLLTDWEATAVFNKDDLDPTNDTYFIDPWQKRIKYRKVSPYRILIWSTGPDRIDQIGQDVAGKRERGGDDISNVESDY